MSSMTDKEKTAYDLIKERLAQQIDSVKSLDLKASIVLAMIGVIFTGYLQKVAPEISSNIIKSSIFGLLIIAGIFAVLTFVQKRNKEFEDWRNDPEPQVLFEIVTSKKYKNYTDKEITEHVMRAMVDSYEHNRKLYKKRYNYLYIALLFLVMATIIISVQAINYKGGNESWQAKQLQNHPLENQHYLR